MRPGGERAQLGLGGRPSAGPPHVISTSERAPGQVDSRAESVLTDDNNNNSNNKIHH